VYTPYLYIYTHTYTYIHTYINTSVCKHMHACIHTCIHTLIHKYIHVYTDRRVLVSEWHWSIEALVPQAAVEAFKNGGNASKNGGKASTNGGATLDISSQRGMPQGATQNDVGCSLAPLQGARRKRKAKESSSSLPNAFTLPRGGCKSQPVSRGLLLWLRVGLRARYIYTYIMMCVYV